MNDNEKYTDLMRRHDMLKEDWMRRVEAVRNGPMEAQFFGQGVILGSKGGLRMAADAALPPNARLFELSMDPGDTQVRITFPSGDTYLV